MRRGTGDLMLHFVDVSEAHRREEDLRELAEHDTLTGLSNRLSFNRALEARLKSQPHGTLIMIDLEGFKKVNDTRGHQTGDAVLVVVAQALRSALGDKDLVARIGGDEFAVLLASESAAARAARAMLIRRITIAAGLAARGLAVSASIGMVTLASGLAPSAFVEAADRAMYAAKRTGKGRCVVANVTLQTRAGIVARPAASCGGRCAIRERRLPVKLTIFADGGSRGNPGPAASGAVVYDERGDVLHEVGTYLGRATNNVAEWMGLITGVEAALELGATEIVIRMDSDLVVKQVKGIYKVKHPNMIPLHARAKVLLRRFSHVDIAHVPRKANAAADAVVNQTLDAQRP